jgi:hypothetical protein
VLAEVRTGLVGQAVHGNHGRGRGGAPERLRHGSLGAAPRAATMGA